MDKITTQEGGAPLSPVHLRALQVFDTLPDSAEVPVQVVAARHSVSEMTVWRWAKSGVLPAPIKRGGATRWVVGDLRRARPEGAR